MQPNIDESTKFAASEQISLQGGLVTLYAQPGIYTQTEIQEYFDQLGSLFDEYKTPVALLLGNHNHIMALFYQPGKGWKHMDIGQYTNDLSVIKSHDLAKLIVQGFKEDAASPYICFETRAILTAKNQVIADLTDKLQWFKKRQVIPAEHAKRKEKINLAHIASKYGHADTIAALLKYSADFAQCAPDGRTPAFLAAENGHALVIAEMAKHSLDLNSPVKTVNDLTLAYIAAQNGFSSVINVLGKHNVNLNIPDPNTGVTPAFIAVESGFSKVISILINNSVDMTRPCNLDIKYCAALASSMTPEAKAKMDACVHRQIDQFRSRIIKLSPYDLAHIMGNQGIIDLIDVALIKAQPELAELSKRINEMLIYSEQFSPTSPKRKSIRSLAKALTTQLDIFLLKAMRTPVTQREINLFKNEFKTLAHSKDNELKQHRAIWKPIIVNLLIALTGVGFVALIARACAEILASREQKRQFSFSKSLFFAKTKSEVLQDKINDAFELTDFKKR